jgi:hypothetical protein
MPKTAKYVFLLHTRGGLAYELPATRWRWAVAADWPPQDNETVVDAVRLVNQRTARVVAHFGLEGFCLMEGEVGQWSVTKRRSGLYDLEYVKLDAARRVSRHPLVAKFNHDKGYMEVY